MRHLIHSLSLGVLLVAAGCATSPKAARLTDAELAGQGPQFTTFTNRSAIHDDWLRPPGEPFRLGPGDIITVEMLGDAASQTTLLVGPDGKVYFSLLPGVSVWGLTLTETRELLERELRRYVRQEPRLSVGLRTAGSQQVWLLGALEKPGIYTLGTPVTLLEAISNAGGTPNNAGDGTPAADLQRSFVVRGGKFLPVNFERLLQRGDLSQNIYLRPDDFVFIRAASHPTVYVLGAVVSPNIVPFSDRLSVAGTIAMAGGTLPYASKGRVILIRGGLTQPKIAEVDYGAVLKGKARDVPVAAGDIVYVPFVPYRKLGILAEQILNTFVSTVAINEGSNVGGERRAVGFAVPVR